MAAAQAEIDFLMQLLREYLAKKCAPPEKQYSDAFRPDRGASRGRAE